MMVKNGVSPRKWWFEWDLPGLVNIQKTNWKDPPSLSSVNQLFLWTMFNSYVQVPEGILILNG
jgi:hypothetical protein